MVIMNLVNMFPYGAKVKALVNSMIAFQAPIYNILSHLVSVRNKILLASNDMEKVEWELVAVNLLRKYFLLIAVGLYLHETQTQKTKEPFSDWMMNLSTVYNLYQSITPSHISQYLSVYEGDQIYSMMDAELELGTSG